jgi:PQQ-dependent catabolism-associated CXXCW motif protein
MRQPFAAMAVCLIAFVPVAVSSQDPPIPEPGGYRMDDYRAPTPATLKGARVLTTREAADLWRAGTAVFIDVMPQPPQPAGLPPGTIWRDKPRRNIPGSIWLPDTGYGALAAATEDYLRNGLVQASGSDQTKTLVFYCQKDCWMSWNAAKRALEFGYRNVAWFPDGGDGWQDAGLPLADAQPAPGRP